MSENQTHPNPSREDPSQAPLSPGQTANEDPGIASEQTAVEPTAEQSTVVLRGDERRRSVRGGVRHLLGNHADQAQARREGMTRARMSMSAIVILALCLAVALVASVIPDHAGHAREPRRTGSARCARTSREEHPGSGSHLTVPAPASQRKAAGTRYRPSVRPPVPTVTSEPPGPTGVPSPPAVSEQARAPAIPVSEAQADAGEAQAQSGGGPFSP
jgi:hypothetical protein